jgi:hyperosmotically inducible protein
MLAAALLAGAGVAGAADKKAAGPVTDADLANSVRHEIAMYANYSVWDDVDVGVTNGNVHLSGAVLDPAKKVVIEKLVGEVAGVVQVQNDIRVLPASPADDRLRRGVARAIYGDPSLRLYANQPFKPIHILVENGRVTLSGVVNTELDKQLAGTRASAAGLSFGPVVNNLQVAQAPAKKS